MDTTSEQDGCVDLPLHEHEKSKDYLLRIQKNRPDNVGRIYDAEWENCRLLHKYQAPNGLVWCFVEIQPGPDDDNPFRPEQPKRYKMIRMRTKKLAGGRTWVPAAESPKARSVSVVLQVVKLSYAAEGLGVLKSQVQAVEGKYAWASPLEENVLGYGCKRFALSTVTKAVKAMHVNKENAFSDEATKFVTPDKRISVLKSDLTVLEEEVLAAYKAAKKLKDKKTINPKVRMRIHIYYTLCTHYARCWCLQTGKPHGTVGMRACCIQIEQKHHLPTGTLIKKERSLLRRIKEGPAVSPPGAQPVLPPEMEENLMLLVLAMDHRGDISAGDYAVRHAVGHYIKGTAYESAYRRRYPGAWCDLTQTIVPGIKWYKAWLNRMCSQEAFKDVVEANGIAIDCKKLRYYNTDNINKHYDKLAEVLCHQWRVAKQVGPRDDMSEIEWITDLHRVILLDESAMRCVLLVCSCSCL